MVTLLPRLTSLVTDRMLDEFLLYGVEAWRGFEPDNLPDEVRFAPTGGTRASVAQLQDLRSGIVKIAKDCGFGNDAEKKDLALFDSVVSAWLVENPILASGESLRDDTWTFIGVAMAPDIVHWRFGASRERYLGGVRNTFKRLWMRGRVLDRGLGSHGRWDLLYELTEDALVQITERPSIGGDPILARAIAEAWVRAALRHGKSRMEPIMRHAVLRIRIQNEIRSISSLSRVELGKMLDAFFDIAEETITASLQVEAHRNP